MRRSNESFSRNRGERLAYRSALHKNDLLQRRLYSVKKISHRHFICNAVFLAPHAPLAKMRRPLIFMEQRWRWLTRRTVKAHSPPSIFQWFIVWPQTSVYLAVRCMKYLCATRPLFTWHQCASPFCDALVAMRPHYRIERSYTRPIMLLRARVFFSSTIKISTFHRDAFNRRRSEENKNMGCSIE